MDRYRRFALVLCAIHTACGGSDVTTSPHLRQTLFLADAPDAVIGFPESSPEQAIGALAGAVILKESLVVVDATACEARFFSLDGAFRNRVGGCGSGPNEFSTIAGVVAVGDSAVAVWDRALGRLTILTEKSSVDFKPDLSAARNFAPEFVGVLGSGVIVFQERPHPMSRANVPSGIIRDTVSYLLLENDGSWDGRAIRVHGNEEFLSRDGNFYGTVPVIFGPQIVHATSGDRLVLGETTSNALRIARGHDDVQVSEITPPLSRALASPADVTAARARMTLRYTPTSDRPAALLRTREGTVNLEDKRLEVVGLAPARDSVPRYEHMLPGSDGVWIGTSPRGEEGAAWYHIGFDGVIDELLMIPDHLKLHAIRGDLALLSAADQFDRVHLTLYKVIAPNAHEEAMTRTDQLR